MDSNDHKTIINPVFDSQMKTLLRIKDFRKDFLSHSEAIKELTQDLVSKYEEGAEFLKRHADSDYQKEWEESLNNVMVQSNQMNQVLALSDDFMNENKQDHDFQSEYNDFVDRRNQLSQAALQFESIGSKALSEENLNTWNERFVVWKEEYEPQIENENVTVKLIYDFQHKYSQEDLVKITEIISQANAEEVDWNDPVQFQQQYIKAIQEFQREFKPKNLWDNIMEILAGGVHPSPSERMMLEQWADGEQKTREDM
ncbi:hypothetical protein [Moheibacter stercoris]|uniref:mRNA-degrading endonuclease YafQ of YafQ-DinJ toxin-antitoxin module n=1 Tax=Moheibacter stercoris TaxID=1628251 RepID=A0ABV2LQC8_9FLAO